MNPGYFPPAATALKLQQIRRTGSGNSAISSSDEENREKTPIFETKTEMNT